MSAFDAATLKRLEELSARPVNVFGERIDDPRPRARRSTRTLRAPPKPPILGPRQCAALDRIGDDWRRLASVQYASGLAPSDFARVLDTLERRRLVECNADRTQVRRRGG